MGRRDPLLEDVAAATVAVACLGTVIAFLFWWFTGMSPWPMVILGECAGLGFGVGLLALASPRRR